MVRLGIALGLLLAALPAVAQERSPLAEVGAALVAGDTSRAYRIARDASRADRDDVGLARVRLRLEVAGHSDQRASRLRYQQVIDVAQQVLRLSPGDPTALQALASEALWSTLALHDERAALPVAGGLGLVGSRSQVAPPETRKQEFTEPDARPLSMAPFGEDVVLMTGDSTGAVPPPADQDPGAAGASLADERARTASSRFAIGDQDSAFTSEAGRAAAARARLGRYLGQWKRVAPDAVQPHLTALIVAALDTDWGGGLTAAREVRARQPRSAESYLYLGLANMRLGNVEAAEAAFDQGIAMLPEPRRSGFGDLSAILSTDDLDAYRQDPEGFEDAYWATHDPRLSTPVSERRVEHYARVVEADLLFGLRMRDLEALFAFDSSALQGSRTTRGAIWVRYGRPVRTLRFVPHDNVAVYGEEEMTAFNDRIHTWEYPTFRYVFYDSWGLGEYELYAPKASAYSDPRGGATSNDDYVLQDRFLQREEPTQTQVVPSIPTTLLASRFRQPSGQTEAVVAYGVPLADAAAVPSQIEVGVFRVGRGGVEVVDQQTARPHPSQVVVTKEAALWAGAATIAVSGADAVRVEVGLGAAWGAASMPVEPLPASGFGLSDLLLATAIDAGDAGAVVRDGLVIVPAPWEVVQRTDPLYVYVETYGLALEGGRTRYSVAASLVPEARRSGLIGAVFGRGQRPGVAVETESSGDRADEATYVVFDLAAQEPGRYALRLEVTDRVTGAVAETERIVTLE